MRFSVLIIVCILQFILASAGTPVKYISIHSKHKIAYQSYYLTNPNRFVLDIKNYTDEKVSFAKEACISKIRSSKKSNNSKKIVFDLSCNVNFKPKLIQQADGYLLQFTVDNKSSLKANNKKKSLAVVSSSSKNTSAKKVQVKKTLEPKLRDIIVVIDAGHGGHDPGAISNIGIMEKNVALSISKKIVANINTQFGFSAYLTRDSDKYLGLRQRLYIAKQRNADLFISIHADSNPNKKAKGVSVYALSERGATSEAAKILADKENVVDISSGDINRNYILQSILIDLQQVETVHQSLNMGKKVLANLSLFSSRHRAYVEQAAFVVLKSSSTPSILIETGFLSNDKEANNLASNSYQVKLASAISEAVVNYFSARDIAGTYLANKIKMANITVVKGNNLYSLCREYNLSIESMMRLNKLTSTTVHVGQILKVPIQKQQEKA